MTNETSLVRYDWSEFSEMSTYGSLFLRHLRKEGKFLSGNREGRERYLGILASLPAYSRVDRDIQSFEMAIDDCMDALESGDSSIEFELSSIATVVRHASILGCYLVGTLEFSRYESVRCFCLATQLRFEIAMEFPELYNYRIAVMRNKKLPRRPEISYAYEWVTRSRAVLREVTRLATYAAMC